MEYDQLTRDLAHKAADDVCAAMSRTMALHPDLSGRVMIATMAAGQALAAAAGVLSVKIGIDNPEAVADALWATIRPTTVDAIKAVHGEDR
jgi:hypothetical protein